MLISASYFKNIDRIFSPQYLPNDQDVLYSRLRTKKIVQNRLVLGNLDCPLIDVGGSPFERKQWAQILIEGVHCVIFTASLSAYDESAVMDKRTVGSLLLGDLPLNVTIFY